MTSSGLPPLGASAGTVPIQAASPSTTVSADGLPAPMKDQRDQERPFSADSNKNVPGRPPPSFRYADNGDSESARTFRVIGTTRCKAASSRNCSSVVVVEWL